MNYKEVSPSRDSETIKNIELPIAADYEHKEKRNSGQVDAPANAVVPKMLLSIMMGYIRVVGATGFEPATSSPPVKRATKLRYAPTSSFQPARFARDGVFGKNFSSFLWYSRELIEVRAEVGKG